MNDLKISIADLRRAGLLRRDVAAVHVYHFEKHPSSGEPFQVRLTWDPADQAVKLFAKIIYGTIDQKFSIKRTNSGLVEHLSFICPATGTAVKHLYYVDGNFGSRLAKNIRYIYGKTAGMDATRPPPRKRHRPDRSRKDPAAVSARRARLGTLAALRKGDRSLEQEAVKRFDKEVLPLIEEYEWKPYRLRLEPDTPYGIWEDHPRLDLRVLIREGVLCPDRLNARHMVWNDRKLKSAMLYADLREPGWPCLYLELSIVGQGAAYEQIDLFPPYEGKPIRFMRSRSYGQVQVMAFRGGRFAAPVEQRLLYASQRGRIRGS